MQVYNDCLPCILRGALDAAKIATDDRDLQTLIMKSALRSLAEIAPQNPPPMIARRIQSSIKDITGNPDPYREKKHKYNAFALRIYPDLADMAASSDTPFETAVRLAIAGNIIDFGAAASIGEERIFATIEDTLKNDIIGDITAFEKRVADAEQILWLADNTGEIVFDRVLLERMDKEKVTYAVRGGPILNDATLEDAVETGLTDIVNVIDNGTDIPGTSLEHCCEKFRTAFAQADLIVSKGQGNYETLPNTDDRIFYLFKVKCPVVAADAGCREGASCCLSFGPPGHFR